MRNLLLLTLFAACSILTARTQTYSITQLQTDHMANPIGIDNQHPRFTWQTTYLNHHFETDSFTIYISSNKQDIYKESPNCMKKTTLYPEYTYEGVRLQPFTTYYWKVVSPHGKAQVGSPIASFETGMMGIANWQGAWISDAHGIDYQPAPYFRKQFTIKKAVKKARAYIAAGGLYMLRVNGLRQGNHFLDPAFTRYDRRTQYVTLDITPSLHNGANALGVVLGNGWYNHQAKAVWDFDRAPWRNRPTFCMDVRIEYTDGTTETIATDLSWKTSGGQLVYNNIYTGEHVDFRIDDKAWSTPGFDDSQWQGVRLRSAPAQELSAQEMPPIRLIRAIDAISCRQLNDTTWIYDFGTNMAGITAVSLSGPRGTKVRVTHGERLYADGTVDMRNIDIYYRGDKQQEPFQTDCYTLSGSASDTYQSEFSYKGFRYVQVTISQPLILSPASIKAYGVHSDVPEVGTIESGNRMLNLLFAATNQAYISNLMGYPTDCPQREKNGWTGDGHLAIETGLYSYDAISVYDKWMQDFRDEQQPNGVLPDIIPTDGWGYGTDNGLDWTSAVAIVPWNLYLFTGDERPLRKNYENIRRYVDYVDRNSPSHLSSWGRGDWVPVKSQSDKELSSSIYFYVDATILAKAAELFELQTEAEHYSSLAKEIKEAINAKFLNPATGIYANGTQTEMSMPLYWGIVPDELRQTVADHLAANVRAQGYHLDVGVLGCKAILNALSENNHAYEAYRLAVQDTPPSWGWWIRNGATSLHENWDVESNRDGSDNHIMFGEIGAWLYKGLGGIFPDEAEPGFRHIILRPNFIKEIGCFKARHTSPYGEIVSAWQFKGNQIVYSIDIPAGCTATAFLKVETKELKAGHHEIKLDARKWAKAKDFSFYAPTPIVNTYIHD